MIHFSSQQPARILLVEDHPLVRRAVSALLEQEGDLTICGEAAAASEALSLIKKQRPHLALIDITLKGGNGLELVKQIKSAHPEVRMLVLSMHDEVIYAERVLRAGASGYVHKHESGATVLEAIRAVLADRVFVSDDMKDRILHRISAGAKPPGETPFDLLSDRELQVLDLLRQGFTSRDIAEHLHLSPKTVHTYREHLKKKLGLKSATELMRFAHSHAVEETGHLPDSLTSS